MIMKDNFQRFSEHNQEVYNAINQLKEQAGHCLPFLMDAIEDGDETAQIMAAIVLGEIVKVSTLAIPVLVNLLGDENNQGYVDPVLDLMQIGEKSASALWEFSKS